MKVESKFDIDEKVSIKALGVVGVITFIGFDGVKINITVRYFDNGSPQSVVFMRMS